MMYHLDDVRQGFDIDADVVVVGSGPGGSVAAANLAQAGLRTVVLEAGPLVKPEDMTRHAPRFLARYYWEGGLRVLMSGAPIPSMHGRCVGGGSVVNSAIMLKLPDWVRREWIQHEGLHDLAGPELDAAFDRAFAGTKTTPTPMTAMGTRNLVVRDALAAAGLAGKPLPRAVEDCDGCGDCAVGCASGRKQSMDRSYLPRAQADGADVYTCAQVDKVLTRGKRVIGVTGDVVDPHRRRPVARFRVRAPLVFMAAGVLATPVILQRSRINPHRRVGATFFAHLTTGIIAAMPERVDPWVGATQGWGAISDDIRGMKFECLWAPPSLLSVRWAGIGHAFLRRLPEIKHWTLIAIVYRGQCRGTVRARRDGLPHATLKIPAYEAQTVMRGAKQAADGLLKVGASYVTAGRHLPEIPEQMRSVRDTEGMLSRKIKARHLNQTANHVFGSCRMSADPYRGPVDRHGQVRGVEGLYVCDASFCPSPTAVNPQATIMALSDLVSGRVAELDPMRTPH